MTAAWDLARAAAAGAALGGFFFAGLWWTVRGATRAAHPAVWFGASALIRLLVVSGGFPLLVGADPMRLLLGLLGFLAMRIAAVRIVRLPARQASPLRHAP